MERYKRRSHLELIQYVCNSLHPNIRKLVNHSHWITNIDRHFIGFKLKEEEKKESITRCSFCSFGHGQDLPASDRRTTIVFIDEDFKDIDFMTLLILHELGHVLDESLGLYDEWVNPLDSYAEQDQFEAFATAFQSYNTKAIDPPLKYYHTKEDLLRKDPYTFEFFEKLKRGDYD